MHPFQRSITHIRSFMPGKSALREALYVKRLRACRSGSWLIFAEGSPSAYAVRKLSSGISEVRIESTVPASTEFSGGSS
jgi:hypothetical protein